VYPANPTFPELNASALTTICYVFQRVPTGGTIKRGPYKASRIPTSGDVQVPSATGPGQMVQIDEKWFLPTQSGAKPRSILRDITSGLTYEIVSANAFGDFIECFVLRKQADP